MTPNQSKLVAAVTAAITAAAGAWFAYDPAKQAFAVNTAAALCAVLSTYLTGLLTRRPGDLAPLPEDAR